MRVPLRIADQPKGRRPTTWRTAVRIGVAVICALIAVSGAVSADARSDRFYRVIEFSPDGDKLLLDIYGPEGAHAIVEIQLDAELESQPVKYDCRSWLSAGRYINDGDIILALGPTRKSEVQSTVLVRADAQSSAVETLTELPGDIHVQDLAISADGQTIYVSQVDMGNSDNAAITRYDMAAKTFEIVFDGFEESQVEFLGFAGVDGSTVSFTASKRFDDLTREDVRKLGQPRFLMTDEALLLFETTDDPDVAELSRHYPLLQTALEDETDPNDLWISMLYYIGFSVHEDFGQPYVALDTVDAGIETSPVINRIDGNTLHPLLDPAFEFERFAVSAAGNRVALIHRTESGTSTITLFEQIDGAWTSRSLQPALDMITSLDCVE